MYLNKSNRKDIIYFLKVYKQNYIEILDNSYIRIEDDCLKKINSEISKIDMLITKLT